MDKTAHWLRLATARPSGGATIEKSVYLLSLYLGVDCLYSPTSFLLQQVFIEKVEDQSICREIESYF